MPEKADAGPVARDVQEHERLETLERVIGYRFRDRAILHQATTHRSFANESEEAIDGILFARGAGVGPAGSRVAGATVNDVTPTILSWFGIPIGQDMDGRVMEFLSPFVSPTLVASHRDTPIEKVTTAPSGVEGDIIERLRMIGYLQE